jgi:8-amino-7-oxononanoate synthase
LSFLRDELADLDRQHLLRRRAAAWVGRRPSFCSNDYLGLAQRRSEPDTRDAHGGSGASRLVTGERPEHGALERDLAGWLQVEDALVFTSGYAANLGTLTALAGPGDLVVSDALNHASIIDGIRLSRATACVVPHLDVTAVRRALSAGGFRRAFVAVESYFSMDADGPDLRDLAEVCTARGAALLVDEAHALGVLGPDGRGLCAQHGVRPDVLVGTLGKAIGVQGGFVAGNADLTTWLWNRARSFVFSTGISPHVAACARANLERARHDDASRAHVAALAVQLREGMTRLGLTVLGHGHIIPWVVGAPDTTMAAAAALRDRGFDVRGIRPPTVPEGTARVRLTVTAAHAPSDIDDLLEALRDVSRETLASSMHR